MIIEADPIPAGCDSLLGELVFAAPDRKNRADQVENEPELRGFGVGAEIERTIAPDLAGEKNSRKTLVGDDQPRVALVVLEVDVVAWLQLLDKVVFEDQRFDFRAGDDDVQVSDVACPAGAPGC